ncbi:MAG: DUF11 domain-containing protein, partial [Gammaproteobacteria bacterium]|nr:DUF11 domain-containing protein [Gammaproteobacteria bacterium]
LAFSKTAADINGSPLVVGDEILYTLQVTNTGSYTAYNVTVTDDLPTQVVCQAVSGDNAPGCADPLIWLIPSLAPTNTVATLYITVTVETGTEGDSITNTASVTSSNVTTPPDPPTPVCPDGSTEPCTPVITSTTTLTVTVVGNGSVGVIPTQATYTYGEVVTLTAVVSPGWVFTGWSGNVSGSAISRTLTMTENKVITATFSQDQYTLETNTVGTGWILTSPVKSTYTYGEVITLTAFPSFGWTFTGWSGDLSGNTTPVAVTMTGDKAITATFVQEQYILTVSVVGNGSVTTSPAKSTYTYGEVVTLTTAISPGWTFNGWSGDLSGNTTPVAVTMTGDKAVTATFITIPAPTTTTLVLSKSALDINGTPLLTTDTVRYTLLVTNTGSYTAFNVVVTDTMPVSMTLVGSATLYGAISGTSQIIWNIGTVPQGDTATMVITTTLQADTSGQFINNMASVQANNATSQAVEICPDNIVPAGGVCNPASAPEEDGGVYLPIIIRNN